MLCNRNHFIKLVLRGKSYFNSEHWAIGKVIVYIEKLEKRDLNGNCYDTWTNPVSCTMLTIVLLPLQLIIDINMYIGNIKQIILIGQSMRGERYQIFGTEVVLTIHVISVMFEPEIYANPNLLKNIKNFKHICNQIIAKAGQGTRTFR